MGGSLEEAAADAADAVARTCSTGLSLATRFLAPRPPPADADARPTVDVAIGFFRLRGGRDCTTDGLELLALEEAADVEVVDEVVFEEDAAEVDEVAFAEETVLEDFGGLGLTVALSSGKPTESGSLNSSSFMEDFAVVFLFC